MKKLYITIALILWGCAQMLNAQNMYRNYASLIVSSPESTVSIVHSKGYVYDFQTQKGALSVAQIFPDNMHLTGNNACFILDNGSSDFILQGGFETFDGNMVLYGYDGNCNHCPAFGVLDPLMLSFKYFVLDDSQNNGVSFIEGCCGWDDNGVDVDYLFVRDDGIISAIPESSPLAVVNILPLTENANRYTDVSWDPYHNLFIASGTAWTGFHYATIPFVDLFALNYAIAATGTPSGINHVESYAVDSGFDNPAPEGRALHTLIDSDSLILYYDLNKGCNDIVWLTLIQDFWNSSHAVANSSIFLFPNSKIAAFDLVYDNTNNRLNLLGAMRYICREYTCFLAQTDPHTLNYMNIGQLDGGSVTDTCQIPYCQDLNQSIDVYGSSLKVQKLAWNYHTPYSPVLVSGIGGDINFTKSILTETYDISLSHCDNPLINSNEFFNPDIYNLNFQTPPQNDTVTSLDVDLLGDVVSENFLCDDPAAYSHLYDGEKSKVTLEEMGEMVDIVFVDNRQFICHNFIGEIQYTLYAIDGKIILNGQTSGENANYLPSSLRGVFLLRAIDNSGNQVVKKVVL